MGNHPSAIADDGVTPIHTRTHTVRGALNSRSITATTVNASVVHARYISCQHAIISKHHTLPRNAVAEQPHRAVTAHTVSADEIYADEINCKTLRCVDVHVGEGTQWRAKRLTYVDREKAHWDGKEDPDSEASDDDVSDNEDSERGQRKKAVAMGLGGALAAGLGVAAFAFFKHKRDERGDKEKAEKEKREREERERRERDDKQKREKEDRDRRERDDRYRSDRDEQDKRDRENRDKRDREDRESREREDKERREREERERHDRERQHTPSHNTSAASHSDRRGNFQLSSHSVRLWSDGMRCFLVAECSDPHGTSRESRLDLDDVIGTTPDGEFRWVSQGGHDSGKFSGQAQRWELVDGGAVMVADLPTRDGSMVRRRFDLAERIQNRDGALQYMA